MFAPIADADVRELQALDEFIRLKERQIARIHKWRKIGLPLLRQNG